MFFLFQQLLETTNSCSKLNVKAFMLETQQHMLDNDVIIAITKIVDSDVSKEAFFKIERTQMSIKFYEGSNCYGILSFYEGGDIHQCSSYETDIGSAHSVFKTPIDLVTCILFNIS